MAYPWQRHRNGVVKSDQAYQLDRQVTNIERFEFSAIEARRGLFRADLAPRFIGYTVLLSPFALFRIKKPGGSYAQALYLLETEQATAARSYDLVHRHWVAEMVVDNGIADYFTNGLYTTSTAKKLLANTTSEAIQEVIQIGLQTQAKDQESPAC